MPLLARLFAPRPRIDSAQEEDQRRSWAELKAGRLPVAAQERLASQIDQRTYTSALSIGALAALKSVDYEPVGQAFGTSTVAVNRQQAILQSPAPFTTGPYVPWPIRGWFDGERQSRERALRRMQTEARELGAHGVIGIRTIGATITAGLYEYTVIGTAVRASADPAPGAAVPPFLTALDGADFAGLLRSGWRPSTMIFSMVRWSTGFAGNSDSSRYVNVHARRFPNVELDGLTELQTKARAQARLDLDREVRKAGAEGMLLHGFDVQWERDEARYDIEVRAFGTAITRAARLSGPVSGPRDTGRSGPARLDIIATVPLTDSDGPLTFSDGPLTDGEGVVA